jgi:hypothetical protein
MFNVALHKLCLVFEVFFTQPIFVDLGPKVVNHCVDGIRRLVAPSFAQCGARTMFLLAAVALKTGAGRTCQSCAALKSSSSTTTARLLGDDSLRAPKLPQISPICLLF